jgi:PTH1 family peptidyl-tRNA hydrolase
VTGQVMSGDGHRSSLIPGRLRRGAQGERATSTTARERWLVIGLGNPGLEYVGNRHNAGRMVVEKLADRMGVKFKKHRARADIAEGTLSGVPVTLGIPRSYMNVSGGPVAALRDFYKIPPNRIIVVHDELDVPFGEIRLKLGGGAGGHNGLRSVSAALGSPDYFRVRFGIGRPPGRMDPAVFVLRDFGSADRKELPLLIERCADAVEALITDGLGPAQNAFHARA